MNMATLQTELTEAKNRTNALLERTMAQAANENRVMTAAERAAIQKAIDEGKDLRAQLDRAQGDDKMRDAIDRLTGDLGAGPGTGGGRRVSIGQQITSNPLYEQWIKSGGHRASGPRNSPVFELSATTLDESSGSGGSLVIPDARRGIVELPTRPLTMLDLIAPGTTNSNMVQFMKETSITNAAAAVAEAGVKPESTIVFAAEATPVKKIATWIPATEEILEDVPTMMAYLDARLRLFVDLATDDEILNGSGVGEHVEGFLAQSGLSAPVVRVAEANADTVLDQIMSLWIATNLQPTGIVMNPAQWKTILKFKTVDGIYYGGGPFSSPHAPTLWGLPVALTTAIVAGTCLVGSFRTASQWFEKSGLRVDVSNSHASFFVENKIAIRAERRGALVIYRPSAFGLCTNLN